MTFFFFNTTLANDALVLNGKSNYKIYVSLEAHSSEQFAAHKLQKYIEKTTGCRLDVVHQVGGNNQLIYVGFKGASKQILAGLDQAAFKNEEYIIRSDGATLLISGGGTRGTLYGVVGYLSDHLGCRWYTRDLIKTPKLFTIKLSKIEDRQKPKFEYREAWYNEAYDTEWAIHNRLNPSITPIPDSLGGSYITYPFVHTFYKLVPPSKYFDTNPEYFSEVDGKRIGENGQLCLTNPEVVKIAVNTIFNWYNDEPTTKVFSVDQNDGAGNCTCKNCKAIDDREGSPSGSIIHFVNQVADSVKKVYPEIQLQTLAYFYSEVPPKYLRPAENVIIRLCHYNYCSAHPLAQCDRHKQYVDRLLGWKKISKNVTIWDYYTNFAKYLMPFPNFETLKHDVKFYADQGVMGLFAQGNNVPDNGGVEFTELRAWVFSQLMWNPNQDAQALIDEFILNVYGNSAPYIQAYIKLLHDQVKPDSAYFSIWSEPTEVNYLSVSTIQEADRLFELAFKSAGDDSTLVTRVEKAYLPVLYTRLYFYSIGGTEYLKKADLPLVLDRFDQIMSKNKITAIGEIEATYGNLEAFRERVIGANSFISHWEIVGPFNDFKNTGLEVKYAPEDDLKAPSYVGLHDMSLVWKKHENQGSGYIDFTKIIGPFENVVAYAKTSITVNEATTKKFGVGSNDGVRVWVNDQLVLDRPESRKAVPNQDIITVEFPKGQHRILVKVDQLKRGWGFYFTEIE